MKKIAIEKIYSLFDEIAKAQKLYIPVDKGDIAEFTEYSKGVKLSEKYNTNSSAKGFFFPQMQFLLGL